MGITGSLMEQGGVLVKGVVALIWEHAIMTRQLLQITDHASMKKIFVNLALMV